MIVQFSSDVVHVNPKFDDFFHQMKWRDCKKYFIQHGKPRRVCKIFRFCILEMQITQCQGLFTPWTVKSSEGHVKHVTGRSTRPKTTSVYTKEKNVRVIMKFEVPNRHVSRPTLSTDMVQRVSQKRCSNRKGHGPIAEKRCYNSSFMKYC